MTIDDLLARREGVDFEAKLAQGQDGRGAVPRSLWETYAAMANTQGGDILLGARERSDGTFEVAGIDAVHRVTKSFWDEANNRSTVSTNLLRDDDLRVLDWNGRSVLHIAVPRATRHQRPVYVGANPLVGTYRRNYEGDYRCTEPEVRRMIADADVEQRDVHVFPLYGIADLDGPSLASFRNEFRSASPNHVWLTLSDQDLLEQLGGWRRDRASGEAGLTLAGLLMFGTLRSILDNVPDYVLDYRELADDEVGPRWVDRLTTDGTWSGNLYGFYRRVYAKLVDGIRIPFQTDAGRRVDESPVHRALREALVNALIHADYAASTPTLVQKRRGGFSFRNPGALRIPPDRVRAGGVSDCRNRALQKMFQMIGAAEQAGSGFPTIIGAWAGQHWRPPNLVEEFEPETVTLRLSSVSLLPDDVLARLARRFGAGFSALDETERLAVATAATENRVSNGRLQELCDTHPSDLTALLQSLVRQGFLESRSARRWAYYVLPATPADPTFDFPRANTAQSSLNTAQTGVNTAQSEVDTAQSEEALARLQKKAERIRSSRHAPSAEVRGALLGILEEARDQQIYLTSAQLADVLGRTVRTVLPYLNALAGQGRVRTKYAGLRAPRQGYQASPDVV